MTLAEITELFAKTAERAPSLGKSIKFVFDEGIVHIDLTGAHTVVSNEDKAADCTITTTLDTLNRIRKEFICKFVFLAPSVSSLVHVPG